MRRSWARAREKVDAEGHCRNCGSSLDLQAAHIIPRSRVKAGPGEDPRNIMVLCGSCHQAEHDGRLELAPLLTLEESGYVAGLVGLGEAYRRCTRRAA